MFATKSLNIKSDRGVEFTCPLCVAPGRHFMGKGSSNDAYNFRCVQEGS